MKVKQAIDELSSRDLNPEQEIIISCCEKGRSFSKLNNIAIIHDIQGKIHVVLYPHRDTFQDPWDVK